MPGITGYHNSLVRPDNIVRQIFGLFSFWCQYLRQTIPQTVKPLNTSRLAVKEFFGGFHKLGPEWHLSCHLSHISVILISTNQQNYPHLPTLLICFFSFICIISGFIYLFVFPVKHSIPKFAFFKFLILSSETCQLDHDCVIQYNLNLDIITAKTRF